MRTITGLEELKAAEGETLGTSDWHEVTQKDVDTFADVTGDHQWIHVDVERAKETPFGGTIAHGYFTLILAPAPQQPGLQARGLRLRAQLRPQQGALPGARCRSRSQGPRARRSSRRSTDIPGGAQIVFEVTFEREGGEKPVCVAETVVRVYARLEPDGRPPARVAEDDAVGARPRVAA